MERIEDLPIVRQVHGSDAVERGPDGPAAASEANIRLRAFQIYVWRGRYDGHEVDDWYQAERELRRNR